MLYDALAMRFRELKLRRNPECPACGDHPTITKLIDYQEFCGMGRGQEEVVEATGDIDATEVKQKIDRGDDFVLIDVREPHDIRSAAFQRRS
jgi:adenylyltransferase/sulfurtransferase